MESPPQSDQSQSTSTAQVLLGLFVVGQLLFLLVSNALEMLSDAESHVPEDLKPIAEQVAPGWTKEKGHFYNLSRTITRATDAYAQLTGQEQQWSLFAPNVYHRCGFPALEFHWQDDFTTANGFASHLAVLSAGDPLAAAGITVAEKRHPNKAVLFKSDNEPEDIHDFVRWGRFRLRRLESPMTLYFTYHDGEPTDERKTQWATEIRDQFRTYGELIDAYVQWRRRAFAARNPDMPPATQIVLVMRTYRIQSPPPGDEIWTGPTVHRVARWLPGATWRDGFRHYQLYDPVDERFESVRK